MPVKLRRIAAVAVALVLSAGASVLATASPASAATSAGLCSKTLSGWTVAPPLEASQRPPYYPHGPNGQVDTGGETVVWYKPVSSNAVDMVVQFRNLRANGKFGLVGIVGTSEGSRDLGATGTVGAAPNGAWCSRAIRVTTSSSHLWSSLSYFLNGVPYGVTVEGLVTVV